MRVVLCVSFVLCNECYRCCPICIYWCSDKCVVFFVCCSLCMCVVGFVLCWVLVYVFCCVWPLCGVMRDISVVVIVLCICVKLFVLWSHSCVICVHCDLLL